MKTTTTTTFWNSRLLTWLLVVAVIVYLIFFSTRIIGLFGLLSGWLAGLCFRQHRRRCFHAGCAVFFAAALLPIDITFHFAPGPPRFVPYVSGLPSKSGIEADKRGEIHLTYSCIASPNEPRFVLVW